MTAQSILESTVRAGDCVLIGQANAEPPSLVRQLIKAAERVPGLTAYCGYTLGTEWDELQPGTMAVRSFIVHGAMRRLASRGLLDILPWHISAFADNIERGLLPVDVVLLRVAPADERGYFNLGPTADYVLSALARARAIVVEVCEELPPVTAGAQLHRSGVSAVVDSDTPLLETADREPTSAEVEVAARVATLIPRGSAIQLGLGPLSNAVVSHLPAGHEVRVISGMLGDWLVDLAERGVLADEPDAARGSIGLGSQRFYDFVRNNPLVRFVPTAELVEAASLRPLVAVNSAIEVDVSGQVNAEVVAGRYVGGIGGQVDFFRAARRTPTGLGIVAMSACHPDGSSRIVESLSGVVTTARSDIDVVVTEYGIADVRAASLEQRREALRAIAAPEHRPALA